MERLKKEGQYIYEREASVNQKRVPGGGDVTRANGKVFFGRRKRMRLAIRLREKAWSIAKMYIGREDQTEDARERKTWKGNEQARKEATLRGMAARLARRPWKEASEEGTEHKTLAAIRAMKETELRALIRMIMAGLDQAGRSIARANAKLGLRGRSDVAWVYAKTRSPVMGNRKAKSVVETAIKRWSGRVRAARGKTIICAITWAVHVDYPRTRVGVYLDSTQNYSLLRVGG